MRENRDGRTDAEDGRRRHRTSGRERWLALAPTPNFSGELTGRACGSPRRNVSSSASACTCGRIAPRRFLLKHFRPNRFRESIGTVGQKEARRDGFLRQHLLQSVRQRLAREWRATTSVW
jgi:hypothetical protein